MITAQSSVVAIDWSRLVGGWSRLVGGWSRLVGG